MEAGWLSEFIFETASNKRLDLFLSDALNVYLKDDRHVGESFFVVFLHTLKGTLW